MQSASSFGRLVRERRRALDLTQEELARRVACAPVTLRKIEYDELRPSQQIAERLAMALGIAPEDRAEFVRRARAVRPAGKPLMQVAQAPASAADEIQGHVEHAYAPNDQTGTVGLRVAYPAQQALTDSDTPYHGLRAFQESDAATFFGRETFIQRLLVHMGEIDDLARFLAIVGPSGSGKSSVVRAGLIPALRRGALPGSERWQIATITPGRYPLEEIEDALLRVAANGALPIGGVTILAQLQEDARGLVRAVRRVLPRDDETELVLVIDQFEEIFTLVAEGTCAHILALLVAAVLDERSRIRILVTIRADFLDRPLQHVDFGELLQQRSELILPLTPDELERAIEAPAQQIGIAIEEGLSAVIIHEASQQPGTLPLLQHALSELFLRREGRLLTHAAYREIGGIAGSLCQRAEAIYAGLDATEQIVCRQLFLRLVAIGDGAEATRQRSPRAAFAADGAEAHRVEHVLRAYGAARLLLFDYDSRSHTPTIEVTHEALIRSWPRLQGWLAESRELLMIRDRLGLAAREWRQQGRDPSYLANGERLAQFIRLQHEADSASTPLLNAEEQAYLEASSAEASDRERQERMRQSRELSQAHATANAQKSAAQRLRLLAGALALFLVLASGLSAYAFQQRGAAEQSADAALQSANEAQASFTRAEAQRLAGEANRLVIQQGNVDVARLLAARSLQLEYTPQGDESATAALSLPAPALRLRSIPDAGAPSGFGFSPNGSLLIIGDEHGGVRLWDVASGSLVWQQQGLGNARCAIFSPDGSNVIACDEAAISVHETSTGTFLWRLTGHTERVFDLVVAPDNRRLFSLSADQTIRVWDLADGTGEIFYQSPDGDLRSGAISHDGRYLLVGGQDMIARILDAQTGVVLRELRGHTDWIRGTAFTSDDRYAVTSGADRTVRIWDVATGTEIRRFDGHANEITDVVLTADDQRLLTCSLDQTARIWDFTTGRVLQVLHAHDEMIWGCALSLDGRHVATGQAQPLLWDLDRPPEPPILRGHSGVVDRAAISADARTIFSSSTDASVRIWDRQTGRQIRQIAFDQPLSSVNPAPDGTTLLITSSNKGTWLWDLRTDRAIWSSSTPGYATAFSPDGRYAAISIPCCFEGLDLGVTIVDLVTYSEVCTLRHDWLMGYLAFSPDGNTLLTGGFDWGAEGALIWDRQSCSLRRSITDSRPAAAVAITPDGSSGAIGYRDGSITLWDLANGTQLQTLAGHTDTVKGVSFSADGRLLASASVDGTVRLWDLQTGQELRRLRGHIGSVNSVVFAPDNQSVVTSGSDGTVRVWDVGIDTVMQRLCGSVLRDLIPAERAQYGIVDDRPICPKS